MKNKKLALILLIPVIIIQILIPIGFMAEKNNILDKGTEYKIMVNNIYAENENKLRLDFYIPDIISEKDAEYAVLEESGNGIYQIARLSGKRPSEGIYIKSSSSFRFSNPLSEYRVKENNAYEISENLNLIRAESLYFYCTAKIHKGKAIITGLYTDKNIPVENYIKEA